MENIKMEDLIDPIDSTSETTEEQEETTAEVETETEVESEQDPLKTELERVQNKSKYTEEEKAEFTFKKTAERLKALGKDPASILGIDINDVDEDDTPLTMSMYRKMQQENTAKSALQQADDIQNETEKELVKYHLQNTIKSTGIPSQDLKLARALVNAVKNTKIIEEVARRNPAKTHSNSSGVDSKQEQEIIYTPEEQAMMRPPFSITPEQVLAARQGKSIKFKK